MPDQFPPKSDFSKQAEIEERLTAELQAARLTFDFATEQYKRAVQGPGKLGLNHPDGQHRFQSLDGIPSLTEASNSQRDAFEKYQRALEAFNKFVRRGELPNTDETSSPR